jgi:hypothetical protein
MAYASLADVQNRMPQFVLTAVSKPTADTAQVFIDDTQASYDAVLANLGYVIPLTGARALAQSKEIVSQGAICKILHARAAAVGTEVALQSAERACAQYQHALDLIADPNSPVELGDAERTEDFVDKPSTSPMGDFHSPPDQWCRASMTDKY